MITVKVVRDTEEFKLMGAEWDDLLERSLQKTPYLTHEWLYSWWEVFGSADRRLYVLLFSEADANGGKLMGIMPTFIQTVGCLRRLRVLRFLGTAEHVGMHFLDLIVDPEKEEEIYEALFAYFKDRWEFHVVELCGLPQTSKLLKLLKEYSVTNGITLEARNSELCTYIPLPDTYDCYYSALSSKMRRKFRDGRKLETEGAVLEVLTRREDLDDGMNDLIRLHNIRRTQDSQIGLFHSDAQRKFHKLVFERLVESGWLKLAFLKVHTQRVATLCQIEYGGNTYAYTTGFDAAWARNRAGYVLFLLQIEEAIKENKGRFEFGRGRSEYKRRLGSTAETILVDIHFMKGSAALDLYIVTRAIVPLVAKLYRTLVPKRAQHLMSRIRKRTRRSLIMAGFSRPTEGTWDFFKRMAGIDHSLDLASDSESGKR